MNSQQLLILLYLHRTIIHCNHCFSSSVEAIMKKTKYQINRNKRKFILDWLNSLRTSSHLNWPIHTMTNKQWFSLFKRMNLEHAHLFHDVKYFSLQVNNIIDLGLFRQLSKSIQRRPTYKVEYTISDVDYLDTTIDKIKEQDDEDHECK